MQCQYINDGVPHVRPAGIQHSDTGKVNISDVVNKLVAVSASVKDMYFVAGVLMALSLAHGGAAYQFFSKWMYQWISQGAKTINVFRACLGAQLTICAQK